MPRRASLAIAARAPAWVTPNSPRISTSDADGIGSPMWRPYSPMSVSSTCWGGKPDWNLGSSLASIAVSTPPGASHDSAPGGFGSVTFAMAVVRS